MGSIKKLFCKRGHERCSENLFKGGACKLCDKLRDRTEDNRNRYQKDKENQKKRVADYRAANLDTLRIKGKEYARIKRAENPEKRQDSVRRWQKANPDKNYAAVKSWIKKHPEKPSEYTRNRRALKAGAVGSHTKEQFYALCRSFGNFCLCCFEEKPLTEDHVVPLTKGGSNYIENIQPLCVSCNSRKRNLHDTDYRAVLILAVIYYGYLQYKSTQTEGVRLP